jgi:photosystem II stability/assembly factor-like uncharacterized protein
MVTLLVFNSGVEFSSDGGQSWNDYSKQALPFSSAANVQPDGIVALTADTINHNDLYAGAKNGLFRSTDNGKSWKSLTIIESSKKFPVHAIAINPQNSNEIVYAAGNAFYRSVDGGAKWATTQLEIDRGVGSIEYEPSHSNIIYFVLRKF